MGSLLNSRFSDVTQHYSTFKWAGALRDDNENGCVADWVNGGLRYAYMLSPSFSCCFSLACYSTDRSQAIEIQH